MNEHTFGVTRRKVTPAEAKRRDRICRRMGGHGYQQVDQSHGTAHGGNWVGWFTGPNRGEPFDSALAREVLAAVENGKAVTP